MADIALTTADRVEVVGPPVRQKTGNAGEDITAGAPCTYNSTGALVNSDANGAGVLVTVKGMATRTVKSGESLTILQEGRMDGFALAGVAYGGKIYLSETVGRIADATPAGGTNSTTFVVGHVEPVGAVPLGTAKDKILEVNIAEN